MSRKITVGFLLVILTLGLSVSAALAFQATYFGEDLGKGENVRLPAFPNASAARASFLAQLVGVGTENFESFSIGAGAPLSLTFPGAGTATLLGSGSIANVPSGTNGFGRYPTSGNQYWEVSGSFSINFSNPVAAFGFYGIDIGDFGGNVTLKTENGQTVNYVIPHTINGSGGGVLFFGVIDTNNPFVNATFGNTAAGIDVFGFDDMTIGSVQQVRPVPVPATILLMGSGLLSLGLRRMRRQVK